MKRILSVIFILLFCSSLNAQTITKGSIGEQDFNKYNGVTSTFTRATSSGGTITLNKVGYEVDALMSYGGGVNYTNATITSALTAIGTTNKVALVLRPGTWVVSASVNWAAYTNVTLKFAPGAVLSHGAYTISWGGAIEALPNQQIRTGTGAWTLTANVPEVWVDWFGVNTTPGTTDMINPINTALNAITTGEIRFLGNIYAVSTTILSSTALHPVKFRGTGKIEATGGTRIKWIGGNSDSIIELNSYMQMEDIFVYNGNASTSLIGIDLLGDAGQPKTNIIMKNVHVKTCAVNYAFNYAYYNELFSCKSSYGSIGFDLRTEANSTIFHGCKSSADAIGITNENGTGSRQILWNGGSIEAATAYGIKTLQASTLGWVFVNPYLESNYQHLINGHIKIDRPFINDDGGAGTRPPFDISGSSNVEINSPYMSAAITQLFTISGLAAAYNPRGITIKAPFDAPEVAASIYATPAFLTGGYINADSYIKVETGWFTASGAISENIITVGEGDGLGVSATLVYAQIIVDTAVVVTGSNFTVTMGRTATFDEYINTTFTTDRAVGVYNLALVGAAAMTMYPTTYTYKVTGTAETSGKYKIVLFFIK